MLAQVKAGKNSNKLKNEIKQTLYLSASLQQFNQVIRIMEKNMFAIRDPKTVDFDWPKDVDENLKHEIEFIIKSNESSADNKCKHGKCKHV